MNWPSLEFLTIALLVIALFFLSVIESAVSRLSRVSLKVLAERERSRKVHLLEDIAQDRTQFLLPLQFVSQLLLVAIAVVVTVKFVSSQVLGAPFLGILVAATVIFLFQQLFPRIMTESDPEKVLLRLLPFLKNLYPVLLWLSIPVMALLRLSKASRDKNQLPAAVEDEATEEEIQAYLGVGEEEGIIEEDESELIQSALEFGDTLVRAIMTPRTEMVAVEENASISELKSLIVSSKFSRIPVYREQIDQIIGVVYVRNLLSHLGEGRGDDPITPLINKAWFVPETKKVSELLKEMQRNAEHLAVVINEYASVSGLATIEDVIEEIVGEIRDEDETEEVDLVSQGERGYIVRGGAEIEELEEVLNVDLGDTDVTTMSGFVVDYLGKVPSAGETVLLNGLLVEILSSDRKKIQSMRVKKVEQ